MEKEKLTCHYQSATLNVTANKIDSYRMKEETRNTVRVYQNGAIGIAGSLGEADDAKLTAAAVEALEDQIKYPCRLEANTGRQSSAQVLAKEEFLPKMQNLLDRISEECPRFAISNKISLSNDTLTYQNSVGADLYSSSNKLSLELVFKNRDAGNVYDGIYYIETSHFDADAVVADFKKIYDAFYTPVDLDAGNYPVFFLPVDILWTIDQHFSGELYASGASLLSGKLGQKVANEKFTFCDDRNQATNCGACFFDAEGQVPPDYRQPLIQNGVFTNVVVSKGIAEMFGLPAAATSCAPYDGVPFPNISYFYVAPTAKSPAELAPGKAVLVSTIGGGDITPDGHFASPVQLAFLVENGEIVGRLPEINISADFHQFIGDSYLGAVQGAFFPSMEAIYMACRMDVTK